MLQPPTQSPGAALRTLLSHGTLILPGVFNAISALSAQTAGARALYLSGAGITNASLGVPDIGLGTLNEFATVASAVCSVSSLPVICDADTGFGGVHNVTRAVTELERAGLAGIHLEDQESPKRCGHLNGKAIVPVQEMVSKMKAAVAAKRDPSFWIVARTDARGVEGLEAAIKRAKTYVDAGADAIFPEGLESESEFAEFRAAVSAPLIANMTEFGKTPIISAARFSDLGYEMVIFPMTAFRVMLRALDETYSELLAIGTQAGLIDRMRSRQELYQLLEYPQYDALDKEWSSSEGSRPFGSKI